MSKTFCVLLKDNSKKYFSNNEIYYFNILKNKASNINCHKHTPIILNQVDQIQWNYFINYINNILPNIKDHYKKIRPKIFSLDPKIFLCLDDYLYISSILPHKDDVYISDYNKKKENLLILLKFVIASNEIGFEILQSKLLLYITAILHSVKDKKILLSFLNLFISFDI